MGKYVHDLVLAERIVMFAWFISRTFSTYEQYFSLTTNQATVLSAMAYQPSEYGKYRLEEPPKKCRFTILHH